MIDFSKIKEKANSILDIKEEDKKIIAVKELCDSLDEISTERDTLINEKADLTQKFREAVLNAHLPATGSKDENGANEKTGKSWEECIAETLANKKK